MKNRNYRQLLTAILVLVLVSIVYVLYVSANENDQKSYYNIFLGARTSVATIQTEITKEMVPAHQFASLQHDIVAALGKNWTSSEKNIAKTIINRMEGSVAGVLNALIDQTIVSEAVTI